MSEISRSSIFRNKIKQEAAKRKEKEEKPKVNIGVIGCKRRYTLIDAIEMTRKNNASAIFESPEEEKKFSEITHRPNYEKSEEDKIIEI